MPYVEVPKYTDIEGLKKNREFKKLMDRAVEIKQTMAALDEELADLKDSIEAELITAEINAGTSVDYNGYRVLIVDKAGAKKLDKKKLLALLGNKGVEILKKATVEGAPSHYLQISSPKDEKESDE